MHTRILDQYIASAMWTTRLDCLQQLEEQLVSWGWQGRCAYWTVHWKSYSLHPYYTALEKLTYLPTPEVRLCMVQNIAEILVSALHFDIIKTFKLVGKPQVLLFKLNLQNVLWLYEQMERTPCSFHSKYNIFSFQTLTHRNGAQIFCHWNIKNPAVFPTTRS